MSDERVEQDVEIVLVDDPAGVVCEECAEEAAWANVSGFRRPALLLIGAAYYGSVLAKNVFARINDVPIQGFDLSGADPEEVSRLARYLNDQQALGERGSKWEILPDPVGYMEGVP